MTAKPTLPPPSPGLLSGVESIVAGMSITEFRLDAIVNLHDRFQDALANERYGEIERTRLEMRFELRCAALKIAQAALGQGKAQLAQEIMTYAQHGVPKALRAKFLEIILTKNR